MLVHSLLIEGVDLRRLGGSARGNDFFGNYYDRCPLSPGQEKRGPLARKGACDGGTDRTAGSIDHGHLVFQHHVSSLQIGALRRRSRGIAWLAAFGLQRVRRLLVVKFIAARRCVSAATDCVL